MNSPANTRTEQMEIDASAKWPVLVFFGSALLWLLLGGLMQLAAAMQLHQPGFLAACEWVTHGPLAPASQKTPVYGWGLNTALAFRLGAMGAVAPTAPYASGS